jgi:hypothetical protein
MEYLEVRLVVSRSIILIQREWHYEAFGKICLLLSN